MKRSHSIFLLKLLAGFCLFGLLIHLLKPAHIIKYLGEIRPGNIAVSFLLSLASLVALSARLFHLLGLEKKDFYRSMSISLKGIFFNSLIPGNLGNDVYRYRLFKSGNLPGPCLIYVFLQERLLGLYLYLLIFAGAYICLASQAQAGAELRGIFLICCAGIGAFIALFLIRPHIFPILGKMGVPRRILTLVTQCMPYTVRLACKKGAIIVLLTLISFLLFACSFQAIGFDMRGNATFEVICMSLVIVEIARFIPITPQGIGVREGVMSWFFSVCGLPAAEGFTIAAAGYIVLSLAQAACGLAFFLRLEKPGQRS